MISEELDRWLDVCGRAWDRKDIGALTACLTEDDVAPWDESLHGRHGVPWLGS